MQESEVARRSNMTWKLFLDDQIHDPSTPERHTPEGFVGAASTAEAIALVEKFGPPSFIDFDHDLGMTPQGELDTAKVFLKWLFEHYPDSPPENWRIHSKNCVAAPWIDSYLRSWRKSLGAT